MELSPHNPKGFKQRGFSFFKIIGTTCLLSGIGVAAFFAWDQGYIPGNKRAISAEAMREAIEMKIALDTTHSSLPCVSAQNWTGTKPDRTGLPGIAFMNAPGLSSKTYLIDQTGRAAVNKKRHIREKTFLAKQGFYNQEQVALNTDKGLMKALRFTLNLDGYLATAPNAHSKECFTIGERVLKQITGFTKLEEKVIGQEAWKVEYQTQLVNKSEWVDLPEAREMFHRIDAEDRIREHSTVLIRAEDSWVLERIAYWQVSRSQVDERDHRKLKEINQYLFFTKAPLLHEEEAANVLNAYVKSDQWRYSLACLPFRLSSGGDDRMLSAIIRRNRSEEFSARYFDMDMSQRKSSSAIDLATQLSVWNALDAGGFVKISDLDKGKYQYYDKELDSPAGLQLTLDHDVKELLNIGSRRRCVPFGGFEVELLGVKRRKLGVYKVLALGKPKATPKWVLPVADKWPALKHAIEQGVIIQGTIYYEKIVSTDEQSTNRGEWKIQKLNVVYPITQHQELPSVFQPIFGDSHRSWPRLKAPINAQEVQDRYRKTRTTSVYGRKAQLSSTHKQMAAKSKIRNNHSVTIRSPFEPSYVKKQLIAEYGGAGAATPWFLSKVYSSGRYYFEAQGTTVGQLSFSGHANISLSEKPKRDHFGFGGITLIKHGEQKLRSNKDIFGIAIDYDKGTLYHHINGEWMTGAPGENAGLKIKKNTQYSPIFVATGNKKGRKGVYWDINLGRNGFVYEIPNGFKPYGS